MYVFLIVVHLLTAFVMIGAILLQSGKGAEIGATFGGSSQTIFGGRGATTFLAKFTVGAAIVFMLTSVSLSILSKQRSLGTSLKLPPAPAAKPSDGSIPAPGASSSAPSTPSTGPAAGSAPAAPTTAPTASSGTPSAPVAGSPSAPAAPPAAP
jgi:preprotein translocase subunit SecG